MGAVSADAYTVERHPHGLLVRGAVPLSDLLRLTSGWKDEGYDHLNSHVARAMRATLAVGTKEGLSTWLAEINHAKERPVPE